MAQGAAAPRTRSREHEAGRLAVGHRADPTVLASAPLTTPATALPGPPVLLTVLDGRPRSPRREPLTEPAFAAAGRRRGYRRRHGR
ncbi:hypothetical protein [Streptomyces sp. QHH-9511]|uniref:hypothetical protein n=1 Tax=Streptomyces sp. QHH-9511 TaxID=2684468 RepID=UPI0018E09059|nr:hypothetical protein [Streptomyces sp. QHH-9511]